MEEILEESFSIRTFLGVLFTSVSSLSMRRFVSSSANSSAKLCPYSTSGCPSQLQQDDLLVDYRSATPPVHLLEQLFHLLSFWFQKQAYYSATVVMVRHIITQRLALCSTPAPITTQISVWSTTAPPPPRSAVSKMDPQQTNYSFHLLSYPEMLWLLPTHLFPPHAHLSTLRSTVSLLSPKISSQSAVAMTLGRVRAESIRNKNSEFPHAARTSFNVHVFLQWQQAEQVSSRGLEAFQRFAAECVYSSVLECRSVWSTQPHPLADATLLGRVDEEVFPELTSWMTYSNDIGLCKELRTFYKRGTRTLLPKASEFSSSIYDEEEISKQETEKSTLAESATVESSEDGDVGERGLDFYPSAFEEGEDLVEVAEEIPLNSVLNYDRTGYRKLEDLPRSYFSCKNCAVETAPTVNLSHGGGRCIGRWTKVVEVVWTVFGRGLCRSSQI
eukprot:GHVS01076718.1.p1 GENE.GHVS01076718.1~~GHVS01076718.1.p1  ORF type:complete len:444 (-),score=47.39 GHVS01076718.1:348-1679(-)